jgi:hypothetical protein
VPKLHVTSEKLPPFNGKVWRCKPVVAGAGTARQVSGVAQLRGATAPTLSPLVTFEPFTAVTMKNAVLWDIKPQLVPHRRHITSPPQRPAG